MKLYCFEGGEKKVLLQESSTGCRASTNTVTNKTSK